MKIAFLVPTFSNFGGVERVTALLTNSLAKDTQYDIHVIAYYSTENQVYELNNNITKKHIFETITSLKKGMFKAIKYLRHDIKLNDYDILIACGSLYFPMGVLSTIGKKTKLILWEHNHYFGYEDVKLQKYTRRGWIEFADAIVTLTESDKRVYLDNSFNKNIFAISNPLDPAFNGSKVAIKQNKIISVGRLVNIKNFDDCIDAAKLILDQYPDWSWDIYGEGKERKRLQDKINRLKLNGRVNLLGNYPNIYDCYCNYMFLVSTSKSEGFGLAILEAMAAGLPAISYDVPHGPKELIDNNQNGFLIEYKNQHQLISKIIYLIENDMVIQQFSMKSLEKSQLYKIDAIKQKWDKCFNTILNK